MRYSRLLLLPALLLSFGVFAQPYAVQWTDLVNTQVLTDPSDWGTVRKNAGSGNVYDAAASSINTLGATEDGWVEFTAYHTNRGVCLGLTRSTFTPSHQDIEFGITLEVNQQFFVNEGGVYQTNGAPFNVNDKFRIEVVGTAVNYYHNYVDASSTPVFVSTKLRPTDSYIVDVAFRESGARAYHVEASFNGTGGPGQTPPGNTVGIWSTATNSSADSWTTGHVGVQIDNPSYDLQVNGITYLGGATPTIGLDNTYRLYVENGIRAERVKVDLTTTWADYVFERDYPLASLAEVKAFIDKYHHLPGIPDAATVEKEGVDLGEMNVLLLQKIEEMTLHMIRMQEQIDTLKELVESQE